MLALSPRDLALVWAVAGCLDDDGYLRMPLEQVADALPLLPPPEPQELLIALRRVQALDPAGVGARSVCECSPIAIRGLIEEMIAGESAGKPLPDVEIARELGIQGLKVARRTVTKYRQLLRIETAERRRGAVRADRATRATNDR